ncbi:hypothetical protein K2224_07690 [Streptomyces sp. BHT-5-2]|uniref:hypothetical protein n=1 Tax=unclassified Streptomyces TaxID=2593676 RepID=UPI001C8EB2AE|nr:hypothetical protein [Streptomyces sp. BHT-5-2]QZL07121.1 hypothetical protein K2224_07690 [Streptomyces sp. BHT-5-2]
MTTHRSTPDKRSKHGWMMLACCVPVIIAALVLVATGILSPGFLLVAIMCTAMMALMMRGMDQGSGGRS